jgi:hypothetical protein
MIIIFIGSTVWTPFFSTFEAPVLSLVVGFLSFRSFFGLYFFVFPFLAGFFFE